MLLAQQPREAGGGAQFPGQGSLPARPTERLLVVIFGRRRGSRCSLQQKKLAFDAWQLGNALAVGTVKLAARPLAEAHRFG